MLRRVGMIFVASVLAACGVFLGSDGDDAPGESVDAALPDVADDRTSTSADGGAEGSVTRFCDSYPDAALCADFEGAPLGDIQRDGSVIINTGAHSPPNALEIDSPAATQPEGTRTFTGLPWKSGQPVQFRLFVHLVESSPTMLVAIGALSFVNYDVNIQLVSKTIRLSWWDATAQSEISFAMLGWAVDGWNEIAFDVGADGKVTRKDGTQVLASPDGGLTGLGVYLGVVYRNEDAGVKVRFDDLLVRQ